VEFSWIKAHAEHRVNEFADQLAKEAVKNKNIDECYNGLPQSAVMFDLKEQSVKQWQNEWESTTSVQ
jgi:ribonuclease HI